MAETKEWSEIFAEIITNLIIGLLVLPLLLMWVWNAWMPELFPALGTLTFTKALMLRIIVGFVVPTRSGA